jgi:hypothetical protein
MEGVSRCWKVKKVFALAINEEMEDYLSRLGYTKLAMTIWEKEI